MRRKFDGVIEIVLRINERLADRIFVRHGRQRRHFRDHADRGDHALVRIRNIGEVVIEGRQRADAAGHHRHRMRVAPEALEEPAHLLVHHRVVGHPIVEIRLLRGGRQFAIEQQVAGFQKIAMLGDLLDRIAAIKQDAFVAVDIGDLGFATSGRGEAGIVSEDASLLVKLADVHDVGTNRSLVKRKRPVLVAKGQCAGFGGSTGLCTHDRALSFPPGGPRPSHRRDGSEPHQARRERSGCWVTHPSVHCKMRPLGACVRQQHRQHKDGMALYRCVEATPL